MTRGYTTIEQSKHLVELGLNPSTADMCYPHFIRGGADTYNETPEIAEDIDYPYEMPCWSLTALLELMPCPIILNGNFAYPIVNLFSKSITYDVGMAEYHKEEGYDLIDAAVKTVVWLIEQEHIKVNK